MKIRQATPLDLPELIEMGFQLHLVEKQFEPSLKFSKDDASKRYENELKNTKALFLVAQNEEIAGYLYANLDTLDYLQGNNLECIIEVVYVKPNYRKQGIAKQLISEGLLWAKKNTALRVKAGIYSQNSASLTTFQKSGFRAFHTDYIFEI